MHRPWKLTLTGQTFGRWRVLGKAKYKGRSGEIYWRCKCECGKRKDVVSNSLRLGLSRSCGCLAAEQSRKHGMEGTSTYNAWASMKSRCSNKNAQLFARYGGRGIKVCKKWQTFEGFLADMGERPAGLSLDRINNELDYSKRNCRWATTKQQARNRLGSPKFKWNGTVQSLADIAEDVGVVGWKKAYERVRKGWSVRDAVTVKRANRWHRTDYEPIHR